MPLSPLSPWLMCLCSLYFLIKPIRDDFLLCAQCTIIDERTPSTILYTLLFVTYGICGKRRSQPADCYAFRFFSSTSGTSRNQSIYPYPWRCIQSNAASICLSFMSSHHLIDIDYIRDNVVPNAVFLHPQYLLKTSKYRCHYH